MNDRTPLQLLLSALACTAWLHAQDAANDESIARLREIANREVLTKAAAAQRQADAAAWLQSAADRDLGDRSILRAVAATCLADAEARRRGTRELITWLEHHEALPVEGFDEPTGLAVLFEFLELANAGDWAACRSGLPLLLRACRKHDSVFWLLGRRARDAKTPAGRSFLDEVVVPGLLASPRLDDAERVATLRRLYEVDYTGPRPFVDIAGPGLDGREIRTADHRGRVLLVDYWATWCTPCLMALPGVAAVHRRFRDRGLEVVGVSIDAARDRAKVAAKVKELGLEFPVIFDGKGGKGELALANKVLAVPATFLIDRKGRVRFTNLEGDALTARIAELLDER